MSKGLLLGLCVGSAVAGYLVGAYQPKEDLGTRLRRECASVVRESQGTYYGAEMQELYIQDCIQQRAHAGVK